MAAALRAVIDKVSEINKQNMVAFGIVDRDKLLSDANFDLFWETDDTTFHAAQPYGEKIHVLRRWEMENYLLQPDAFSVEASKRISRLPTPIISAELLLQQAEDIVQVTALTTFLVSNAMKSPKPGFGSKLSGSELIDDINRHLGKNCSAKISDISNHVEKIKAFDPCTAIPEERWEKLSRILDGKKSLMRICRFISTSHGLNSFKHWEEMRGCLANLIASKDSIDSELTNLIEKIEQL